MRIVHVIAGVPIESGGPTQVLREMSARLVELGEEVTVMTTDTGHGRRVKDHGFSPGVAVELWRAELTRSPHPSFGHLRAAWGAAERFDVAHVHGLFAVPPSAAMVAFRRRGLPYVLRPCGMLDRWSLAQKPVLKRAWRALAEDANIRGAAAIQASTEHEAEAVRALLPPSHHDRVIVLPQGVARPVAGTGRAPHPRPYLLFLSRIARKKGLFRLVEAFERLAPVHTDLDLVIVGPDEGGHRAEVEVRARHLGSRVIFTGPATGAAKSDWLGHAELFVLPSDDENFGVVVIEAAHLGTPVVVSRAVGLAPAVEACDAGLVSDNDPIALTRTLDAALANRGRFAPGLAALAREHDWGPIGERLVALYRSISSTRG